MRKQTRIISREELHRDYKPVKRGERWYWLELDTEKGRHRVGRKNILKA